MSRVLVLGGTGSIGRLVVARLLALGDLPRVLTRNPDRVRSRLGDVVELHAGDLRDVAAVAVALDDVDSVVMTHGAPYGSSDYEAVDYGAVPTLLAALAGRQVPVVLMSSIGVTASTGQSRDILGWKRRGERLLRASGLPYTIVRPGWFDAGTGTEQHVDLRQGDTTEYGPVRREHVGEVITQALYASEATRRTVEVFTTDGPVIKDWPAAFAATAPDVPGSLDGALDRPGPDLQQEPDSVRADHDLYSHHA
jgi:uncharacterized protein YbjT (DUF2867 family)